MKKQIKKLTDKELRTLATYAMTENQSYIAQLKHAVATKAGREAEKHCRSHIRQTDEILHNVLFEVLNRLECKNIDNKVKV